MNRGLSFYLHKSALICVKEFIRNNLRCLCLHSLQSKEIRGTKKDLTNGFLRNIMIMETIFNNYWRDLCLVGLLGGREDLKDMDIG